MLRRSIRAVHIAASYFQKKIRKELKKIRKELKKIRKELKKIKELTKPSIEFVRTAKLLVI